MLKRSVLVAAVLLTATACGSSSPEKAEAPSGTAKCTYTATGDASRTVKLPGSTADTSKTQVVIDTDRGAIGITLTPTTTPCTVNSFVSLIKQGFFNNTPCHRLTAADAGIYVLQCGDPSGAGTGGPGYGFANELPASAQPKDCTGGYCTYPAGTVAMAHSSLPDSNGSQFFLVYDDSPLPYDYTIFGQMDAAGLKVVRQIASHGAGAPNMYGNTAPNQSVTITTATVN